MTNKLKGLIGACACAAVVAAAALALLPGGSGKNVLHFLAPQISIDYGSQVDLNSIVLYTNMPRTNLSYDTDNARILLVDNNSKTLMGIMVGSAQLKAVLQFGSSTYTASIQIVVQQTDDSVFNPIFELLGEDTIAPTDTNHPIDLYLLGGSPADKADANSTRGWYGAGQFAGENGVTVTDPAGSGVVSINNGIVTAQTPGEAVLLVKDNKTGYSKSVTVDVQFVYPGDVCFENGLKSLTVYVPLNGSIDLPQVVFGTGFASDELRVPAATYSRQDIAYYDSGRIYAVSTGTVTLTLTYQTSQNATASLNLTVVADAAPASWYCEVHPPYGGDTLTFAYAFYDKNGNTVNSSLKIVYIINGETYDDIADFTDITADRNNGSPIKFVLNSPQKLQEEKIIIQISSLYNPDLCYDIDVNEMFG